ncbi:Kdo hydroxylase family protein [Phycisphaerales bacterium AB-hyl4]|uniref:Kdo hydroxylase family protein n=1 Tax=Natronomicrosphaera hydrolytica TaxID=3242702 RepID=A0ABV4U0K9_9BACT
MARVTIEEHPLERSATEAEYRHIESGDVLFFPTTPFEISDEDRQFLLAQKQSERFHKNISYRPKQDRLKGVDADNSEAFAKMHDVMRRYSQQAIDFCARFLPQYAEQWRIDYASFRPIEEKGRKVKFKARNDLIHVDSFPTRPSHGNRLMRIFTNINMDRERVWVSAGTFEQLAERYAKDAGLPQPPSAITKLGRQAVSAMAKAGLPVIDRPDYDRFMLKFHDYLKHHPEVQDHAKGEQWAFPPGSTWMCFTDTTSHGCLSGQYALEQTFMVARESLAAPDVAPISVLERMAGFPLAETRPVA